METCSGSFYPYLSVATVCFDILGVRDAVSLHPRELEFGRLGCKLRGWNTERAMNQGAWLENQELRNMRDPNIHRTV